MFTYMSAINWGDVGTAVGLSSIVTAIVTAVLKLRELRTVWRRDRLTTAVTDFLPAAASVLPLSRTAHYAHKGLGREDATVAQQEAFTEALNLLDQRMAEVRRLEIPVLLFMGMVHREAVSTYTGHLVPWPASFARLRVHHS
jgi:hypothetical protein